MENVLFFNFQVNESHFWKLQLSSFIVQGRKSTLLKSDSPNTDCSEHDAVLSGGISILRWSFSDWPVPFLMLTDCKSLEGRGHMPHLPRLPWVSNSTSHEWGPIKCSLKGHSNKWKSHMWEKVVLVYWSQYTFARTFHIKPTSIHTSCYFTRPVCQTLYQGTYKW